MNSLTEYEAKVAEAVELMRGGSQGGKVDGLRKRTSNLFRHSRKGRRGSLDLRRFDRVIRIDSKAMEAEVEGMITYEALVEETLPHGLLPPVVPQLKSITVGGAISGGGIESSSFRYGFVHESVLEMDILLPGGEVVTCSPGNEHRDLFCGIANSYGTLGYILRARIPLAPAAPFVKLTHHRLETGEACLATMEEVCLRERERARGVAFVDGVAFSPDEHYVTVGEFVEEAPEVSDYRFMRIFYRSMRERQVDYLRTADYIWRWDTDWFWCARAFGMEWKPLRFLFGACGFLRSTTYWKMRDMAVRSGLLERIEKKRPREYVIQDVEIPVGRAAEFLAFFHETIGILPIWLCPAMAPRRDGEFALYRTDPKVLYINFGFWGSVPSDREPGHFNRLVERKVIELEGKKSLYSSSFFPEEEFWQIYNRPAYERLKKKYDPGGRLRDLYEKCVRGR